MVELTRARSGPARAPAVAIRHAGLLMLAVLVLVALGFALTLRVFWPGVMTHDAAYVYDSIKTDRLGDWQSPVMVLLWGLVDPLAPGPAGMFLLMASSYWLAFGLLAVTLARRSALALALPVLALLPPAFAFTGVIWRDMLFADVWLLAAALAFAGADRTRAVRVPLQVIALGLIALGVLLRPNAVVAAPLLAAYALWPSRFAWRRTLALYVPAALAFAVIVPLTYYGILNVERQNPLHSVLVFDLGGITHFTQANQFPVEWTPEETELLSRRCHEPQHWDAYWHLEPCRFVMERLERAQLFGSPILTSAWKRAIAAHPIAYLKHRLVFTWTFLAGAKSAAWLNDMSEPSKPAFPGNAYFMALKTVHDALEPTILFRAGLWLLLCCALCVMGWRRRETAAGALVLGVCGSAAVYVMTFAAVGVAADFRYAYWAVLATLAGGVIAATGLARRAPIGRRMRLLS